MELKTYIEFLDALTRTTKCVYDKDGFVQFDLLHEAIYRSLPKERVFHNGRTCTLHMTGVDFKILIIIDKESRKRNSISLWDKFMGYRTVKYDSATESGPRKNDVYELSIIVNKKIYYSHLEDAYKYFYNQKSIPWFNNEASYLDKIKELVPCHMYETLTSFAMANELKKAIK